MAKKALFCIHIISIFLLFTGNSFGAGGGGGGSSSSGLGFSSRDSILILVNGEYSEKFSLKNNTKYDLKINVMNGSADIIFGIYYLKLKNGDNYLDIDGDDLADITFRLESIKSKNANLRIIDAKEQIQIKNIPAAEPKKEEKIVEKEEDNENNEFKCSDFLILKERIKCRLELEEEEQEGELELYYLPEECAALSGASRGICIARYKSVQTCWKFQVGEERISCVKRTMNLGTILEEKKKCDELLGENKSICVREIKNKNYNIIKWQFYDLEERAEDFLKRGLIDKDTAVDFIAKTEQNKIIFNEAKTKDERKSIILEVKNDWKVVVNKIREKLGKK